MKDPRQLTLKLIREEHHRTLEFCWRLRKALSLSVEPRRVVDYAEWFYKVHLKNHFTEEEEYIFPVLKEETKIVQRALSEHRKLRRLFETKADAATYVTRIEEALENHIRFEERVLFARILEAGSEDDFRKILPVVAAKEKAGEWSDPFWEK